MAMTHDYLDYLNEKIGISPANSEEELQAAQVISELMAQHDVEPVIEDFSEPKLSGLVPAVLAILSLLGMVLVGVGVVSLTIVGLILAAIPAVLSLMRVFGRSPKISFGPRAQSQNVIAVHRASGPLVTKGSRTIVVCAHYDTPRENFLYTSPVAPYVTLLGRLSVPCSLVVAVCALLQVFGFLPDVFRAILWIVGIVAAVPAVIVATGTIGSRFGACTDGSNDNKSGVAAMLGVLENVRPSGAVPKDRSVVPVVEPQESEDAAAVEPEAPAAGDAPAAGTTTTTNEYVADVPVFGAEVEGVRHGEEVLRSLGILPETCEIEYLVNPSAQREGVSGIDGAESDEKAGTTGSMDATASSSPDKTIAAPSASEDGEADATLPSRTSRRGGSSGEKGWGKTGFIPKLSNLARRASLFDLPDPSGNEVDPLATDPNGRRVTADDAAGSSDDAPTIEPLETITANNDDTVEDAAEKKNPFLSFIERLRDKLASSDETAEPEDDSESDSADDAAAKDDDGAWRGGAATRSGLRLVGDDEGHDDEGVNQVDDQADDQMVDNVADETFEEDEAWAEDDAEVQEDESEQLLLVDDDEALDETDETPTAEDLRDEVLSLRDDALIAHDIWFVALGGSSLDHAGMRAFLANHRSEIRGCFVINLDSIGAGQLVTLKNEGLEETRRADRRISRLLNTAAADLHVELGSEAHDWADTDATPAMRSSLRSVTIMGVEESGLPALSGTPADVAENVDGVQASQVAALVTEVIRRS